MSPERSTLVGTPVVTAPGKVFLVGEYAVLEQGPAVLAAVTRYAVGQFVPGMNPMSRIVDEAVRRARADIGEAAAALPAGSVLVNTDDFHAGDQKLGLGSSAATAVASVGAVFEAAGMAIDAHRDRVLALALAAHRTAQDGAGSGADVMAAVRGGLIRVERPRQGPPRAETIHPPAGLRLVVFWTGTPVSSAQMIEGVQKFARNDPNAYRTHMESLIEIAGRFVTELQAGRATGALAAAVRYGKRLEALGTAAAVPIVTEPFKRAADLAKELGGVAKPSGAGGGDIGVAMFATPESARVFARALQKPLAPLNLDLDRQGVRRRIPDEPESEVSGLFHV